jgi:hypothetical protein
MPQHPIPRFILGVLFVILCQGTFQGLHLADLYPDHVVARMITTLPSPSLMGLVYWGLSLFVTAILWFVADYFLYRRKNRAQEKIMNVEGAALARSISDEVLLAPAPDAARQWKGLMEAISAFCDPALVWRRNRNQEGMEHSADHIAKIKIEMRELCGDVSGDGLKDRPEDNKKYNDLQQKMQRSLDFADLSKVGFRYAWDALRDDIRQRLLSGELIAQGFPEPYKGGDDVKPIKQSEWYLLDIDPYARNAIRKDKTASVIYSGVQISRPASPAIEIIFDPTNPGQKFWSLEQNKDETGKQVAGSHWEYRALVKNRSNKTLRNVKITIEAIGEMPSRPEPSHFDYNKQQLIDIDPTDGRLAVIRVWWHPAIVQGMVCGGAYGPIKMTASADDVVPVIKLFWFDPELEPMISELVVE